MANTKAPQATITLTLTDTERWALEDLLQALSVQIRLTPDQQTAITKTRQALDEGVPA